MSTDLVRTAEDAATDSLFENLVTQFADALDCFRELAQNAMDAGSPQIEVWSEFEAGEGHVGTIALHVDDFGDGMDENIIDSQLTRLFASAKEGDLTKIGKFGIGFVSVFALKPQAVLVHTGRAGEYWEVLFHEDRSFSKTKIDNPVEGTQITIFVKGDSKKYNDFVFGIPNTLKRWCEHSETEITFEDRTPTSGGNSRIVKINSPFDVQGELAAMFEYPGTQIAMAFNPYPEYGFYNRGLTLTKTTVADNVFSASRAQRMQRISVKIKSRYLEHTLSRDTIVRDANYAKAMQLMDQARDGLIQKLVSEVEELAQKQQWSIEEMNLYARFLEFLALERDIDPQLLFNRKIFRAHHGGGVSPEELWEIKKRDGRILIAETGSDLTQSLKRLNVPVVMGRSGKGVQMWDNEVEFSHPLDGVSLLVARYVTKRETSTFWGMVKSWFKDVHGDVTAAITSPDMVYLPVQVAKETAPSEKALLDGALKCLKSAGTDYKEMSVFEPTAVDAPFFVMATELNELMARPSLHADTSSLAVAVNREHPHFQRLLELQERKPQMAYYCLAKSLLLQEDRNLHFDMEIIKAARGT